MYLGNLYNLGDLALIREFEEAAQAVKGKFAFQHEDDNSAMEFYKLAYLRGILVSRLLGEKRPFLPKEKVIALNDSTPEYIGGGRSAGTGLIKKGEIVTVSDCFYHEESGRWLITLEEQTVRIYGFPSVWGHRTYSFKKVEN